MSDTMTQECRTVRLRHKAVRQQPSETLRQTLKEEIDAWPEALLYVLQEFALFEMQRMEEEDKAELPAQPVAEAEVVPQKKPASEQHFPDLATRQKGWEILKKYSGAMHVPDDFDYKEELYAALDEKYYSLG